MSVLIRIAKTPDFVAFWTIWEAGGDAAEIIIEPGAERTFVLTEGTVRVSTGAKPTGEDDLDFENNLRSRPGFQRDGYIDTDAPAIYPMTAGHWIAEARGGRAQGWCMVPLEEAKLASVLGGSVRVAQMLLGGEWDGPYHVHFDVVQDGMIDPADVGRIVQGRKIIDAEMLETSALNDLREVLREERERRVAVRR